MTSVLLAGLMSVGAYAAQTAPPAQTPVPKPFPTSGSATGTTAKPPAPTPTSTPTGTQAVGAPATVSNWSTISPLLASVPAYPAAEFLESIDANASQRLFVFGTNDAYATVVAYYKTQLKRAGEEVSKRPAIHQFDIAPFDSNTMEHRPSVIVKDYTWPEPAGYVHVDGTTEKLFKTLIQVIPSGR